MTLWIVHTFNFFLAFSMKGEKCVLSYFNIQNRTRSPEIVVSENPQQITKNFLTGTSETKCLHFCTSSVAYISQFPDFFIKRKGLKFQYIKDKMSLSIIVMISCLRKVPNGTTRLLKYVTKAIL